MNAASSSVLLLQKATSKRQKQMLKDAFKVSEGNKRTIFRAFLDRLITSKYVLIINPERYFFYPFKFKSIHPFKAIKIFLLSESW